MDPVSDFQTLANGLFSWQGYEKDVKCDLTSTALESDGELIFVDPVALTDDALDRLIAGRTSGAILLTNANHQRDSLALQQRLDIPIIASALAMTELNADLWLVGAEESTVRGLRAIPLPGAGVGEMAFYRLGPKPVLVIGDAVIHLPPEGLRHLPEKYCVDAAQAVASVATLGALPVGAIHFAHGAPILRDAAVLLRAMIARHS
jgi:hypothetical protein